MLKIKRDINQQDFKILDNKWWHHGGQCVSSSPLRKHETHTKNQSVYNLQSEMHFINDNGNLDELDTLYIHIECTQF